MSSETNPLKKKMKMKKKIPEKFRRKKNEQSCNHIVGTKFLNLSTLHHTTLLLSAPGGRLKLYQHGSKVANYSLFVKYLLTLIIPNSYLEVNMTLDKFFTFC